MIRPHVFNDVIQSGARATVPGFLRAPRGLEDNGEMSLKDDSEITSQYSWANITAERDGYNRMAEVISESSLRRHRPLPSVAHSSMGRTKPLRAGDEARVPQSSAEADSNMAQTEEGNGPCFRGKVAFENGCFPAENRDFLSMPLV